MVSARKKRRRDVCCFSSASMLFYILYVCHTNICHTNIFTMTTGCVVLLFLFVVFLLRKSRYTRKASFSLSLPFRFVITFPPFRLVYFITSIHLRRFGFHLPAQSSSSSLFDHIIHTLHVYQVGVSRISLLCAPPTSRTGLGFRQNTQTNTHTRHKNWQVYSRSPQKKP